MATLYPYDAFCSSRCAIIESKDCVSRGLITIMKFVDLYVLHVEPPPAQSTVRASKRLRRFASSGAESDGGTGNLQNQLPLRKRNRRIASSCSEVDFKVDVDGGAPCTANGVTAVESRPVRAPRSRRTYIELSDDEESEDTLNESSFLEEVDPWADMRKEPVLKFLNTAKGQKLRTVMSSSQAKAVRSKRPFASWDIMVSLRFDFNHSTHGLITPQGVM